MTDAQRLVYEEVQSCEGPLCLAGDDLAELKDLLSEAQEGLALRTALALSGDERREAIAALVDLAHECGWNGVDNSKVLQTFLRCHIGDLAERVKQLHAMGTIMLAALTLADHKRLQNNGQDDYVLLAVREAQKLAGRILAGQNIKQARDYFGLDAGGRHE